MRHLPLLLLVCALGGCTSYAPSPEDGPRVLGTTPQVTEFAQGALCQLPQSGDEHCRTETNGLLDGRTDPHDYELRPDDYVAISGAELIVRSGGEVDEWLDEAIDSSGTKARVVDLLDAVGGEDPHWWTDPRAAQKAVRAIAEALGEVDPDNAGLYRDNAEFYVETELLPLDRRIAECIDRVPRERRRVVTTHDSLARFGERYGIEIIGTVLPSRSTQAQASSGDVARLVREIRSSGATAVFTDAGVARDTARAIAEQAGVRLGDPLRIDAMEGYAWTSNRNAMALAEAMSGGKVRCPGWP